MWNCNKIPKRCFFFWGNKPLPFINFLSLVSFRELHPDWEIILIRPADDLNTDATWSTPEQKITYTGFDYMQKVDGLVNHTMYFDFSVLLGKHLDIHDVQRADMLRQYLLYYFGGVWSDMDVLYIKPIHEIPDLPVNLDLTTCLFMFHSSGVVFSSQGNSFYKRVHEESKLKLSRSRYQSAGPELLNTLYPNLDAVVERHPELVIYNFAYHIFYPYSPPQISDFFENVKGFAPETVAVHWFGGAQASMERLNVGSEIFSQPSTFSELIKPYQNLF